MFRLLAAIALLVSASPAFAYEKKEKEWPDEKTNALTPKEIADGWVLLFDGETTFGWKIDGAAEVKDGMLILGKDKKTTAVVSAPYVETFEFLVTWQGTGTIISGRSSATFEEAIEPDRLWGGLAYSWDGTRTNSKFGGPGKGSYGIRKPTPGEPILKVTTDGKTPAILRAVKYRPLTPVSLFNGKNTDGWKINAADPKRMSSKWEVTKDGELSLKNGPGDLVTEKQFDNFVLQLECKTLGKALNSGVFFRCIPGQYQNGYEAQIHNGFKENDRTKPVDFGTGAIYRRVPARKVVSNDNEWFTMTVVADGKHIATWVNGYQTVDWTDDRKENENPRQGFRAAKGPISLQGHDPTTDILFRNIRIAELPK
jgi:hypothetical protein